MKFLPVWDKIQDHFISVIIATIFTTSFILEIFTKIKLITQFIIPLLLWKWSGWITLVIVLTVLWARNKVIKKRIAKQSVIQKPPKYYASFDRRVEEREFAGVIWRIIVGSNIEPQIELKKESVFVWPFPCAYCPECDYELERKNNKWYCMPCKRYYKIPQEIQENTWEKIRRNYQRLVVQWGYNNFGIANDDHKPFRVELKNMKKERENKESSNLKK
ncbi:hypothetical protein KKB43_03900 [Patescibacteria group bacterium]|nr:hypothetical protein [Patescibacteria group bacterium]